MSCGSALYTVNSSSTAFANNAQVPFGSIIRRFGRFVQLEGDSIALLDKGYYTIDISAIVQPSAAGNVTIELLNNGVPVPGAIATESVATADDPVNLHIASLVRVMCCGSDILSVRVSQVDAAAGTTFTVTNLATTVSKI